MHPMPRTRTRIGCLPAICAESQNGSVRSKWTHPHWSLHRSFLHFEPSIVFFAFLKIGAIRDALLFQANPENAPAPACTQTLAWTWTVESTPLGKRLQHSIPEVSATGNGRIPSVHRLERIQPRLSCHRQFSGEAKGSGG